MCLRDLTNTELVSRSRFRANTKFLQYTEQLPLIREILIIVLYCKNHTKHKNASCEQTADFVCLEQVVQAITTVGYRTKLNGLLTAKKKM